TMNKPITNSLTTQELSFIQSRAFGRKTFARSPSRTTSSAGNATRNTVSNTKGRVYDQGWPSREIEAPTLNELMMSVGKTPSSKRPRMKANLGVAVWSFPIHFGGSDVFRFRKVYPAANTRSAKITT